MLHAAPSPNGASHDTAGKLSQDRVNGSLRRPTFGDVCKSGCTLACVHGCSMPPSVSSVWLRVGRRACASPIMVAGPSADDGFTWRDGVALCGDVVALCAIPTLLLDDESDGFANLWVGIRDR